MIIVHEGRAHSDDFLAACVCLHKTGLKVIRSKVEQYMLDDPTTWVLDQGLRFEPEMLNFDHHQLEEEICSLTMVLDHFYGKSYRDHVPELRFLEILDSFGSSKAAEFAGMKEDRVDFVSSPIQTGVLKIFSDISGEVIDPMRSIMALIGEHLCVRVEEGSSLMKSLDSAVVRDVSGISVLDVTSCKPPVGRNHDCLPTKLWCKINGHKPLVVLTMDSRQEGFYRMVSINRGSVKFVKNPLSDFTHASGFLTVFKKYGDYQTILSEYRA